MSNPHRFVLDEPRITALLGTLSTATSLLCLLANHINLSVVYANMRADGVEELLHTILAHVEQAEAELEPVNLDRLDSAGRVVPAHAGVVPLRAGAAHV